MQELAEALGTAEELRARPGQVGVPPAAAPHRVDGVKREILRLSEKLVEAYEENAGLRTTIEGLRAGGGGGGLWGGGWWGGERLGGSSACLGALGGSAACLGALELSCWDAGRGVEGGGEGRRQGLLWGEGGAAGGEGWGPQERERVAQVILPPVHPLLHAVTFLYLRRGLLTESPCVTAYEGHGGVSGRLRTALRFGLQALISL